MARQRKNRKAERLCTVQELQALTGVSRGTAISWIVTGKVKAFKIAGGRVWRIPESELVRLTQGLPADR